jgi:DNA-binding MarR family transcriptional regulator
MTSPRTRDRAAADAAAHHPTRTARVKTAPTRAPQPPADSPEFTAFSEAFDAFVHATKRARTRMSREEGLDLSLSQLHLLGVLESADRPLGVGALAQAAEVSVPTVTRMVDGLVRRGIVARERDTEDRRQVRVSLTDPGRELVERKRAAIRERRLAIFHSLSKGERAEAARLLCRLAEALNES